MSVFEKVEDIEDIYNIIDRQINFADGVNLFEAFYQRRGRDANPRVF
jgi:hypothetical protein